MNKNQNSNQKIDKEELEKSYLENTICTFIFSILGIICPMFLFSVISLSYAKKHPYEKYKKLHRAGEKMANIGIVLSAVTIIGIAIYNWFA